MHVLIVESSSSLARVWRGHLERQGANVRIAASADRAIEYVSFMDFDVIVLNLVIEDGSALAVADYVQYRQPDTNIIFVTDTTFFSDGSIFSIMPSARAFVSKTTRPEDLAAMVEHYGLH